MPGLGLQLGLIQWFQGPEPRGPPGPSAPLCSPSPTVLGPPTGSGDSGVTALPPWLCPRKGSYQHMALTATSQGLLCLGSALSAQPPGQSLVHPGHQLHPLGRGAGVACTSSSVMVPCAQPAPFQSLSSQGKDGEEGGERRPRASAADGGPRGRPALRCMGLSPPLLNRSPGSQ